MKTEARKSFRHGFILTEQELRRIADVATQQLIKVQSGSTPKTHIQLKFKNGTVSDVGSLDELLALENVGSKHIVRLHIGFAGDETKSLDEENEGWKSEYVISLTFTDVEEDEDRRPVAYVVRGADRDWVFVTASELEERIEKIRSRSPRVMFAPRSHFPVTNFIGLLFGLAFLLIMFYSISSLTSQHPSAAEAMESRWKAGTLRDPIEAIIMVEREQEKDKALLSPRAVFGRAIGIPLILIASLAAVAAMAVYLYPAYVFCWGDYTKLFERRVQIRKYVLGVIVVGLIIGTLGSIIANKISLGR